MRKYHLLDQVYRPHVMRSLAAAGHLHRLRAVRPVAKGVRPTTGHQAPFASPGFPSASQAAAQSGQMPWEKEEQVWLEM